MRQLVPLCAGAKFRVDHVPPLELEERRRQPFPVLEKDGATGRFTTAGQYLDGEITTADPQLCGWIGGIQLPSRHQQVAEASLFAGSTPDETSTAPGGAS